MPHDWYTQQLVPVTTAQVNTAGQPLVIWRIVTVPMQVTRPTVMESALVRDWARPEEDEAWKDL